MGGAAVNFSYRLFCYTFSKASFFWQMVSDFLLQVLHTRFGGNLDEARRCCLVIKQRFVACCFLLLQVEQFSIFHCTGKFYHFQSGFKRRRMVRSLRCQGTTAVTCFGNRNDVAAKWLFVLGLYQQREAGFWNKAHSCLLLSVQGNKPVAAAAAKPTSY